MIRKYSKISALALSLVFLFTACFHEFIIPEMEMESRESILDQNVAIESELIMQIPPVERWCDRLKLTKHRINVGDAELYVEEEGKGTPLILINGGPGGTHHYFHPWFSLAKKYARVIYYDQRGCGLSDFEPGEEGYSVQQAVDDLDAIRQALNIDKWVLLGYSYGGFLAQFYTISHPENVAGLILMGASTGMDVDTGKSRQEQFKSEEEKARLKEIRSELQPMFKQKNLTREKYMQLMLYNNYINGDWKRQHFYKPSPERLSQFALYEWVNDVDFNGIMNRSMGKVDLTGAFENNPIPTLILEGKWDLTWGKEKPQILKENHPKARMILFEDAGHAIYNEKPERFFTVLRDFIKNLPKITEEKVSAYKSFLRAWEQEQKTSPDRIVGAFGAGKNSSEKIAQLYVRDWLDMFKKSWNFLRTGFAMYDMENYEEALFVFKRMEQEAETQGQQDYEAVALIWQGHMLDLLGKREDAVNKYSEAADMNIEEIHNLSQYNLKYSVSPYARERMRQPFKRIENCEKD